MRPFFFSDKECRWAPLFTAPADAARQERCLWSVSRDRADSIVGNTGQQCSAQQINRSEFTNYTCERDTMVEEYCSRTASITGDWKYTDEYREVTIPHSQFRFSMNGLKLVFSVTVPVAGTVESASLSVHAGLYFLNSRYDFMNTTFNVQLVTGQSGTFTIPVPSGFSVTQGQVLTGSGCTANGNCLPHGNGDRKVYESLVSGASRRMAAAVRHPLRVSHHVSTCAATAKANRIFPSYQGKPAR